MAAPNLKALIQEMKLSSGRSKLAACIGPEFRERMDQTVLFMSANRVRDLWGEEGLKRLEWQMQHQYCSQNGTYPTTPCGYWGA